MAIKRTKKGKKRESSKKKPEKKPIPLPHSPAPKKKPKPKPKASTQRKGKAKASKSSRKSGPKKRVAKPIPVSKTKAGKKRKSKKAESSRERLAKAQTLIASLSEDDRNALLAAASQTTRKHEREDIYRPLQRPPEEKGKLDRASAEKAIQTVLDTLVTGFRSQGLGVFPSIVVNKDGTVDAEVVLATVISEADDAQGINDRAEMMINDVATFTPDRFPAEVWFSVRLDFQAAEPVDAEGKFFAYKERDLDDVLDDMSALDDDRWSGERFQMLWQRGRERLYGHVDGAIQALGRILKRNEAFEPVVTAISFKLHWNPYVIQPPRLR